MQEVKLRALRTEWSRKREGRRAQEGEWGRRGVRLNTEYIHVWKPEKNEIKNPRKKRKWGSLILFDSFQFIY